MYRSYLGLAEVTHGMTGKDPCTGAALDRLPAQALCAPTIFVPAPLPVSTCFVLWPRSSCRLMDEEESMNVDTQKSCRT